MDTSVQKTIEVPQVKYVERVVEVPVKRQFLIPMVTRIQRIVVVPQI